MVDRAPGRRGAATRHPLEPVGAARPELIAAASSHIEGPSWLAGDLFFAQDGRGLMRLESDGRNGPVALGPLRPTVQAGSVPVSFRAGETLASHPFSALWPCVSTDKHRAR